MLKPAVLYKSEIEQRSKAMFYTMDYFYYIGDISCGPIEIPDSPDSGLYQFASIDENGDLIGFIGFRVDLYAHSVYNFGLLSFDKGNLILARDLDTILHELLRNPTVHRLEWRVVVGNPVEKTYERFCKKHNGNVATLHKICRDMMGEYHDLKIFEVFC